MDITFREYTEADKDTLFQLTVKLDLYIKSLDNLKRIKIFAGFSELAFEELMENVEKYQGKIWFSLDEEKIIGYIVGAIWEQDDKNKLEIGEHKLGEILELYLEEEYRGKGIGKTMLKMMEDYFKSKQCDSIWLDLFAPNEQAHKTYKSFGFVDREIGMLKQI